MTAGDLSSLLIRVVKGNGLQELVTESHDAGEFQTSFAAGMERDKAIRVKTQVAALGARRDYIDLEGVMVAGSTADHDMQVSKLLFDLIEFTGVPTNVQYAVFGEDSPFETGSPVVRESELDGIDRQELVIVNNTEGVDVTKTSQVVRGETDARFQVFADASSATKISMRIKPNEDGVFVLPLGGILIGILSGWGSE
jgi:hypothetical protein